MDCTASIEAKREALLRAQEHELDLAATARCTVMMIFDETFSVSTIFLPTCFDSVALILTRFKTNRAFQWRDAQR